jgi:hypothetical protein
VLSREATVHTGALAALAPTLFALLARLAFGLGSVQTLIADLAGVKTLALVAGRPPRRATVAARNGPSSNAACQGNDSDTKGEQEHEGQRNRARPGKAKRHASFNAPRTRFLLSSD